MPYLGHLSHRGKEGSRCNVIICCEVCATEASVCDKMLKQEGEGPIMLSFFLSCFHFDSGLLSVNVNWYCHRNKLLYCILMCLCLRDFCCDCN